MTDDTRKQYRELSADEKADVLRIKEAGDSFLTAIGECAQDARMAALAKTNCEQAVMWAVKGITG